MARLGAEQGAVACLVVGFSLAPRALCLIGGSEGGGFILLRFVARLICASGFKKEGVQKNKQTKKSRMNRVDIEIVPDNDEYREVGNNFQNFLFSVCIFLRAGEEEGSA